MLLFFLSCLRLDVDNLETTRGVENTITGQMVNMEEFMDWEPNPRLGRNASSNCKEK
jgi:hypothetical protein